MPVPYFNIISPKGNKSCSPFHIWSPLLQYNLIIHNGEVLPTIQPQCINLHGLCMDGKELDDTWMFAWVGQSFHQTLLVRFSLVISLGCPPANSMVFGTQLNLSIHTLHTTL